MKAVKTSELTKIFKNGFRPVCVQRTGRQKRIVALDRLNLEVEEGEIFGYLGPNGAGKTTTFKLLLSLLRPTKGEGWLFSKSLKDVSARAEVGFLPEQPYFYNHLTATEFLDYYAQFFNIKKAVRRDRIKELLARVGLLDAASTQLRKFSRGMLQRIGIAQALINAPKLVFLDEPMSGLDPIGRKQIRDIILTLKAEGKTVFYSSHILSDVEDISDRVAVLVEGKLRGVGTLDQVLGLREKRVEVHIEGLSAHGIAQMKQISTDIIERGKLTIVNISGEIAMERAQQIIFAHNAKLISFIPRLESLEDLFVRKLTASCA